MPSSQSFCTHERRPGTTICLLCRQEEREASLVRRRRLLGQLARVGAGLAVAGVVVMVAGTIRVQASRARLPVLAKAAPAAEDSLVVQQAARALASTDRVTALPAPPAGRVDAPPLLLVVPEGKSDLHTPLGDGVFVERSGDSVTVHFDTPATRTRRIDKLSNVLRTTLPAVYGPAVEPVLKDSLLAQLRSGSILTDLPKRGLHFAVAGTSWRLDVFPETRPGQDGPLLVRYRAALTR